MVRTRSSIEEYRPHFTEGQKPQTRLRHVRRKVERLMSYAGMMEAHHGTPFQVLYEIWCFIPPNDLVLHTVQKSREEGLPVELADLEEVYNRIRQTAGIEPGDEDMVCANAFLWSARLFREAGVFIDVRFSFTFKRRLPDLYHAEEIEADPLFLRIHAPSRPARQGVRQLL